MLAQLHHDLAHQQALALGQRGLQLRDDLQNPSFGKWHWVLRDLLKPHHTVGHESAVQSMAFLFAHRPSSHVQGV